MNMSFEELQRLLWLYVKNTGDEKLAAYLRDTCHLDEPTKEIRFDFTVEFKVSAAAEVPTSLNDDTLCQMQEELVDALHTELDLSFSDFYHVLPDGESVRMRVGYDTFEIQDDGFEEE